MVSILASSGEGHGSDPQRSQIKEFKLLLAASLISMQHLGIRTKSGRLIDKIVCLDVVYNACFIHHHSLTCYHPKYALSMLLPSV